MARKPGPQRATHCSQCGAEKTEDDFAMGWSSLCRLCKNANRRADRKAKGREFEADLAYRKNNPIQLMLNAARNRARQRGVPCTITKDDLYIPEYCPILGIKLERQVGSGGGHTPASPSLDKIDPALGYVPGNVQVISQRANVMKNDASVEELRAFADWVEKTYGP